MSTPQSTFLPGVEIWCEGRPLVGRRAMSEAEQSVLRLQIRLELRRAVILKWVATGAWTLAAVAVGLLVLLSSPRDARDGGSLVLAGLAIALGVWGFIGIVSEIVLGRTLAGRLFCLASAVLAFVGGPWRFVAVPAILAAGMVATGVVVVVGNVMMILRWSEGRKNERICRMALEDVRLGEVLVFEGSMNQGADFRNVEVLPRSNLALGANGYPVRSVQVMPTVVTAVSPEYRVEAPFRNGSQLSGSSHVLRQRHLTEQEIDELKRIRTRIWRRLPLRTLGFAYFVAVVIRIVENVIKSRMSAGLSGLGWGFVLVVTIGNLAIQIVRLRRLKADIERGAALVIRSAHEDVGGVPLGEVLPESGLGWTERGSPAAWRTAG